MPISWMRSADLYPDARYPPDDFIAFDGDEIIGRVYRIRHGTEEGLWFWSMNARGGTEARKDEAVRRVVAAYERMLARVRKAPRGFR